MIKNPKNLVPQFFDDTASTYDAIVKWATFGKDIYWKKEIIAELPNADSFLDLACGTGILTRQIADRFPKSSIVGVDISQKYLDTAKNNSKSYENISYVLQDAEQLDIGQKFDCITSSYIPKYCNPEILTDKIQNYLKQHGKVILHDFIYPDNTFVRKSWDLYFHLLNFVGLFIPSWKIAFDKLPQLIRQSDWLSSYDTSLQRRGFKTKRRLLTLNSSAILIGSRS